MRKFFGFSLLISIHFLSSQVYTPIDTADYSSRKEFLKEYKSKSQIVKSKLRNNYKGKNRRALEKILTDFDQAIESEVKDKRFTFDNNFRDFVNSKIKELVYQDDDFFNNLEVLILKDNTLNAYCIGTNVLVVNMGLFSMLDNDGQLVAILAHELAHAKLNHIIKGRISVIENEKKIEISEINKLEINKNEKAMKLFKSWLYGNFKESRKYELEADSLGYRMYRNTKYLPNLYIDALLQSEKYSETNDPKLSDGIFKKVFDVPNQPFKEKWTKNEDFSDYNYKFYKPKISSDSVKSHPDMFYRIDMLKKNYTVLKNSDSNNIKASTEFLNLSEIAKNQIIPNFFDNNEYGLGVYACLLKLDVDDSNNFAKKYLGKFFQKIYESRKTYTLNRYLDRIEPDQNENYQRILTFLWNLDLEEIKNIADYYSEKGINN